MEIRRGEIYWVEKSPYNRTIGNEQQADRPAIIVSNDANNRNSGTVEIVYLTASPKKKLPTHCLICGTMKPSIALCEQVTTISTECIGRYIGVCTEEEMEMVNICMCASLGIYPEPNSVQASKERLAKKDELPEDSQYIEELEDTIMHLKIELAKAQKGEELMKELYKEMMRQQQLQPPAI